MLTILRKPLLIPNFQCDLQFLDNSSGKLQENLNYVTLNLAHLCDGIVPMFFRYYFYYLCVAIKSLKAKSRPGPVPVKLSQPLMFREKQQKQDPMDKSLYWLPADAASAVLATDLSICVRQK